MNTAQTFILLVALVEIPWGNTTLQPGEVFRCPEIAMGSLFARRQARLTAQKDRLAFFLSEKPRSEEIAAKLEALGLDPSGNKDARIARLTAYIESLSEEAAS